MIYNVPQFLEERYDKGTRNIVAVLSDKSWSYFPSSCIIFWWSSLKLSFQYISNVWNIRAGALVLTIWGIGIIGGIYAIFGGLKAVAVSDTINGVGLVAEDYLFNSWTKSFR